MEPFGIIPVEIRSQSIMGIGHRRILHDVNVVIFDRSPESLDEDIVKDPSTTVHADPDLVLQQDLDERHRRELNPLVAVEDIRLAVFQGRLETIHAKCRIQGIA